MNSINSQEEMPAWKQALIVFTIVVIICVLLIGIPYMENRNRSDSTLVKAKTETRTLVDTTQTHQDSTPHE